MKKRQIDKLLDKWCKKQAKKILKRQAKLTSARAKLTYHQIRPNFIVDIIDKENIQSKKVLRKHIAKLLAEHISEPPLNPSI